ncbi:MAG TPA: hypothetical protein VEI97_15385 [bacterium]|nr:hypothetical protein [bacterium]
MAINGDPFRDERQTRLPLVYGLIVLLTVGIGILLYLLRFKDAPRLENEATAMRRAIQDELNSEEY